MSLVGVSGIDPSLFGLEDIKLQISYCSWPLRGEGRDPCSFQVPLALSAESGGFDPTEGPRLTGRLAHHYLLLTLVLVKWSCSPACHLCCRHFICLTD